MPTTLSDNIFAKCVPAISTDNERCGALTLCDISPTTSDELTAIYKEEAGGKWRVMGALLVADFIGKACQIKQNGMYDWIMATRRDWGAKRLTVTSINNGLHEVMPFVKMGRKGPINNEFWTVTNGVASSGAFEGESYTHRFDVQSQTSIPNDIRWFPDRLRVFISGKADDGTATRTAWRIVGAEIVSGKIRLYTLSENEASYLAAAKLGVPDDGVLVRGTPNVSDYERYCPQIPGLNTNQLTPFWIESTRYGICDDELYRKYITAIRENNPLFKQFGDVPSVEYNRQVVEDWQRRTAWNFFFNKRLANQTLADYDQLETITVYSDDTEGNYLYLPFEGKCIGRRANATGIYEQLAECGRVFDAQGQILNIPEMQVLWYNIMRVRQSNGIESRVIEMFTDSFYATQFAQGLLRYFKYKSEGLLRLNLELSAKPEQGPLGFWFRRFSMDYPQVEIRLVTHPFFDDLADAHKNVYGEGADGPGRVLAILDWSTIYKAIIETNSVTNKSGDINTLAEVNRNFECVMKVPSRSQRLFSVTDTNVVECPQASAFFENFSTDIPEHERKVAPYTDYTGDYTANN